jgi:pimeloyl-ACP methyl ester carboxylesterase
MLDRPKRQNGAVTVEGVDVEYFVAGQQTDRPPLVLIHGTAGSVDSHFGYLFPMFAFRQRVIAMNLADPHGELSVEKLVEQVVAVVSATAPEGPVTLAGYSLGAVVAAAVAARLGAKVETLVLVAGWLKADTHQTFRNHVWRRLRSEGSPILTEFMTLCAFSPGFMATRSFDDMRAAANMLKITPFVDRQMDLNARADISEQVEAITARALVVGCAFDMMVPVRQAKLLFGAIADARYCEIPSGHGVVFERSAELFSLIDDFLDAPAAYSAGAIIPAQKP